MTTAVKESVRKWICVLSLLRHSIWTRSICQLQSAFPEVELLRILFRFKKRREIRCRMSTSSIKRQIGRFHVVVVQWTSKKCTNKRNAPAELLFWSLSLLFFKVVVASWSSLLKLPIILRGLIAFKTITFWKQNFVTVYTGVHVAWQVYE